MAIGFALGAFLCTAGLIWFFLHSGSAGLVLDIPNARSMHNAPVPRIGGACIMAVSLAAAAAVTSDLRPLLLIVSLLAIVSFADDIRGLPVPVRLLAHVAAASVFLLVYPLLAWALAVIAFLAIVWMTNLYNFMDGLDGLAGGMSIIGFAAYAVAASLGGDDEIAILAACIAGGSAGFLLFNLHPARIFMGDAGAIPLGFLAATLGYLGFARGLWPWWFGGLVFSPFIVDATVTLGLRAAAGEALWTAHNSHLYQRMAQSGTGQGATALRWYVLMAAAAVTALAIRDADTVTMTIVLALWGAFYVALAVWLDRHLPPRNRKTGALPSNVTPLAGRRTTLEH